ncbi:MAG: LuxR C-terminal-related transcriptional regulator [bacterium]
MGPEIISISRQLVLIKNIKRLSFLCLPVLQYTDILFDLIGKGVLCTHHRLIQLEYFGHRYIGRHLEDSKHEPLYRNFLSLTNKETGVRSVAELLVGGKNILLHGDIALPNYSNGYLYNEINKSLGSYYIMMSRLKCGQGMQHNGFFTLFRSKDMPPFTAEDASFMEILVPFISYGMSKTKSVDENLSDPLNVAPITGRLNENYRIGSLLVDKNGDIAYLNDAAKNIFFEMGIPDKSILSMEDIKANGITAVVKYINSVIRNVFDYDSPSDIMPARVYTSKTGKSIMMKGYYMESLIGGRGLVNITVEEVFLKPFIKMKKKFLYNLSERELEILELLKENYKPMEIREMLGVTRNTIKAHISHITNKLDLNSTNDLRRFLESF